MRMEFNIINLKSIWNFVLTEVGRVVLDVNKNNTERKILSKSKDVQESKDDYDWRDVNLINI